MNLNLLYLLLYFKIFKIMAQTFKTPFGIPEQGSIDLNTD